MTADELWLRHIWRKHLYRFNGSDALSNEKLAIVKNDFRQKYGYERLRTIICEVEKEVAHEMLEMPSGSERVRPDLLELRETVASPKDCLNFVSSPKRRKPRWTEDQWLERYA